MHLKSFLFLYRKEKIIILKYLGIGVLISISAVLIGYFTGDWNIFLIITTAASVIPLLLSGLLTGGLVGGDRNRANFHTETKQDRQGRNKWVKRLLVISVPNVALLLILVIIGLVTR